MKFGIRVDADLASFDFFPSSQITGVVVPAMKSSLVIP